MALHSHVNREMFREYDIRGKVGRDLTPEVARALGRAFGTYLRAGGGHSCACGRDGRLHSPELQTALMEGLRASGCRVTDIGLVPTPLLYFALFHLGVDGGVEVTASHNPPEDNGFKLCRDRATLYGDQVQEILRLAESGQWSSGHGALAQADVTGPYREYVRDHLRVDRPLKVVLDGGNGAAGPLAVQVFRDQGCEVVPLYCDVDGRFPNHHPDPTVPENLEMLRRTVVEAGADVGMAFDGDGDRLGVVDEKGEILAGDRLLMLFARELLRDHPGALVVGEVKCSQLLYDDIARRGGRPVMWKAGHSLIKQKMRETGALLGGEVSGHFFFADRYFGYDDAIYAGLRLAEVLARSERPMSTFLEDVPKTYATPEIRIPCPDARKFAVVEEMKTWLKARYRTIDIDGVRVMVPGGWGLVRASNTQPAVVLRFEGDTAERLAEIRREVEGQLEAKIHG